MRIAIVSDIHANLHAFRAVLDHATADGAIGAIWCLGDTVGYGPHPNECIGMLREHDHVAVAGNHDLAACGKMGVDEFNDAAATAARWTATQLSETSRDYLAALPLVDTRSDFTFVHGSLREPEWEYLLSTRQARAQFELQKTAYSIVGHTHLPFVCREDGDEPPQLEPAPNGTRLELAAQRLILNPGSAGQPRDGDPRVSYALLDDEAGTVTWTRVEYDIEATQSAMREVELPQSLIDRLSEGL